MAKNEQLYFVFVFVTNLGVNYRPIMIFWVHKIPREIAKLLVSPGAKYSFNSYNDFTCQNPLLSSVILCLFSVSQQLDSNMLFYLIKAIKIAVVL